MKKFRVLYTYIVGYGARTRKIPRCEAFRFGDSIEQVRELFNQQQEKASKWGKQWGYITKVVEL